MSDDDNNESLDERVSQSDTNLTKKLIKLPEESESEQEVRTRAAQISRRSSWYKDYV